MSEKEFLRKKEMQDRAFLQWVTKKNEEEKVPLLNQYHYVRYEVHYLRPRGQPYNSRKS